MNTLLLLAAACLQPSGPLVPFDYNKTGDALEAVVRAFAGGTRPAVRPSGAIYGAETTPRWRIPFDLAQMEPEFLLVRFWSTAPN